MRENNWKKRALSLLLAVMMVLSLIPGNAMPVRAVDPDSRVADNATHDSWRQFFNLEELSTENAGMVWTDKSVFTDASKLGISGITMDSSKKDNFLVALSVMASNKTITGYSTIPTDTMLILDLSGSMANSGCDDDMVDAANAAIADLLAINKNNRVGVVLYSGNSKTGNSTTDTATVILPLGRYSTENDTYLNNSNGTVALNTNVKYEGTETKPAQSNKKVEGGTYIQNGIKQAMDQMLAATTVVEAGKVQAGTVRMPILVLMSDGAPTAATADYMEPETSHMGNGSGNHTNSTIGFVTQLTAAYAKAKVAEHYGRAAKFYTLGLGVDKLDDTQKPVAQRVLNPGYYMHDTTTDAYDSYWATYNALDENASMTIEWQQPNGNKTQKQTAGVTKAKIEITQDYVDEYFKAESSQGVSQEQALINAFGKIVDEIILQSRYTPTLVSSGLHDLDGYVSFVDHIGEHMEVTDIKGMVIGDHVFTGATFSEYIVTGKGGTIENPSELGDEFIRSVKARLGISDTATAQALIQQAYEHGQIAWNSASDFSNYVGWYSDADGNFVGFWYDGIDTEKPANATHINKSYGFLGEADESHGVRDTDMMYATVRIRQEIATGDVTLAWAIPSSLIPTLTYEVELKGSSYDSPLEDIKVSGATEGPIRLIFEVALDEHIHDYNINEIVGKVSDHKDHYDEESGKYTFYSNDWVAGQDTHADNTYAYFEASKENERYYYIMDSVVYNQDGTPYTGNDRPRGENTFFHEYYIYEANRNEPRKELIPIADYVLENKAVQMDGKWIIPKGTQYRALESLSWNKSSNNTGTMSYVVKALAVSETVYHSATMLGNNGKLTVTPATGLKITKTLAETVEGSENKFTFILSGGGSDNATLVRPGANADGSDKTEPLTFTDGKAEFTISADETVYITGLEAGETYTVTEKGNPEYAVQTIRVGGEVKEAANITLEAGQMQTVDFVNAPKGYGNLYITKEVTPAEGHTVPASMLAEEFELTVIMEGLTNQEFTVEHSGDNTLTKVTTDENGKFTVNLKHTETFEVFEIPENTQVTVAEELGTDSNFQVTYRTRNLSGGEADDDNVVTIGKDVNATVVVMNQYTPKSTTVDLDIAGTKTFNPEAPTAAEFTFKVQRYTGREWVDVEGATATVQYSEGQTGDKSFAIDNLLANVTFTKPGEYAFQVLEVIPEDRVDGITYDRSLHTFTVSVADVDGQLTASVTTHDKVLEADENGAFTVEPKFVNTYHTAPIYLDVFKTVENESGSPLAGLQGFVFELYNAKIEDGKWSIDGEVIDRETSDGVGEARFAWTVDGSEVGTHHYILKEASGSAKGWSYDGHEYRITVVVAKDAETDNVTAITTVTDAEGEMVDRITFTNDYAPAAAELDLTATKVLTGRELAAGEFEFAIYADGQSRVEDKEPLATGTNDEDGNIVFQHTSEAEGEYALTFDKVGTYRYDVVEVQGNKGGVTYDTTIYDLVVEVTDNGGELVADYYYEDATGKVVIFRNTYKTNSASLTLGGKKTLTGRTLLASEFTFELYAADEEFKPVGDPIRTAQNAGENAGGVFSFAPITYTATGTYRYVIVEKAGKLSGVAYDETHHQITVVVTDDGAGNLVAKIGNQAVTEKKDYNFENSYTPQEIKYAISGTKTLTGKDLEKGAYTFVLTDKDGNFIEAVTNAANGNFAFTEMTFDRKGVYEYKVYEQIGSENGMTYDETVYDVKIEVDYNSDEGEFVKTVTVNGQTDGSLVFANTYVASVSVPVSGTKVLNGRALAANEFTFVLTDKDGEVLQTVTNAADGSFAFEDLTFWSAGSYEYHVTEQQGNDTSVIYDKTLYHVHVNVTKNEEGTALEATATIGIPTQEDPVNSITFTNVTREAASVRLEVSKVLENRTLTEGEFTFVLKNEAGEVIQTKTNAEPNNEGKNIFFDTLTFDAEGTYTYTIAEQSGNNPYMAYDEKIVTATIVVSAPTDNGPFQATVTYKDAEGNSLDTVVFTNKPNHAEGSFSFKKTDEDDQPLEGMKFTLTHVECPDCELEEGKTIGPFAATSVEDGTVTFSGIPTGHQYTLTEGDTEGYKSIEPRSVTDIYGVFYINGVKAEDVTIVNVAVGNAELILKGIKYLMDGETEVTAPNGAFQFELYTANEDFTSISDEPIQTQINMATAEQAQTATVYSEFIFDAIVLENKGTYYYQIKEKDLGDPDVIYDSKVYNVVVTVDENDEENLVVTGINYYVDNETAENIFFTNSLRAEAQVSLELTKVLDDQENIGKTLNPGDYTFVLKNKAGEVIQTKTNVELNEEGKNIFFDTLTFDKTGTYEYTITEVVPEKDAANYEPYVTYDTKVIHVTVNVAPPAQDSENPNGPYVATVTYTDSNNVAGDETKFTNVFSDGGVVSLNLKKVNENKEYLPGAEFTLTHSAKDCCDAQIGEIKATSREDGTVILAQIPSGHTYTLSETLAPEHYTPVDDMKVEVRFGKIYIDGSDEALNAALTVTNYYDGKAGIRGHKTLEGRALKEGEFTFQMYEADENFEIIGNEPIQTVTNAADGTFYFNAIELHKDDIGKIYYYVVREAEGIDDNIDYDDTVYRVTVTVENVDGELIPKIKVEKKLEETPTTLNSANRGDTVFSEVLEFTNVYTPDPVEVTLSGTKNLDGRDLAEKEFTFEVVDEAGEVIRTAVNDDEGKFSFNSLSFSEAGTYKYQVREAAGELENVVYDTTVYNVTIKVNKNETTGELTAKTTVDNGGELAFTNTYNPNAISLVVEGTKKLTGRELEAGEFEFVLTPQGSDFSAATRNDADGKFSFSLSFDDIGEYKYTLVEKTGSVPGVTYDDTVYYFIVRVTNPGDGAYETEIIFTDKDYNLVEDVKQILFVNEYDADAVNYTVEATKELTGRNLKDGEFEFELTAEHTPLAAVSRNDVDGNIQFNLVFNEAGEYHYTVRELPGDLDRVVYDETVYYFTAVVTDPGDGQLKTQIIYTDESRTAEIDVKKMVFRNVYTPEPIEVTLEGIKTLVGKDLEAEEFSFELKDAEGTVLETVTNDAEGTFAFKALEFTGAGTYTYTVSEVKGEDSAVAYDETVYTVTVEVTNVNGVLIPKVTIDNGGELAFSNTYTKATPDDICVPIVIRKILVNKSDCIMTPAGFRFVMTDAEGKQQHAVSGITGAAGFVLNYTAEDVGKTFTYTVEEIDTGIEDMEYSEMVYAVGITIGLNEETNELYAIISVNGIPMRPAVLTFVNTYEPEVPEEPTEPEPTEPEPTEPEPTEPEPTEPEPTEPEPTEPEPTEPEPTEPEPTEPEPTEPEPTEPEPTEPEPTEPEPTEPEPTEPEPTEPEPTEPEPTEPEPTEPEPTEPEPTEPEPTEPEPTEPEPTETKPTEPKPTKPGNDDVPDTGDDSHLILWALMAGFSVIALYMLKAYTKKGKYSA